MLQYNSIDKKCDNNKYYNNSAAIPGWHLYSTYLTSKTTMLQTQNKQTKSLIEQIAYS